MADARTEILNFAAHLDKSGLESDIQKVTDKMGTWVKNAWSTGTLQGLSAKANDQIKKRMEGIASRIKELQDEIATNIVVANDKALDIGIRNAAEVAKKDLEEKLKVQAELFSTEMKNMEELGKMLKEMEFKFEKGAAATAGKTVEAFSEGLHGIFADITSKDLGSMAGIFKKMGASLQAAQKKAAAAQQTGTAGGMDKLMGMLGKLGPALMMVGAIAAGFAAVAKIIIDADAQAKGLHKTLMEGGASVGDLIGATQDLKGSLKDVRDAAIDFKNNADWGTMAADQMKLMGAFNEAGYTFKEMAGTIKKGEKNMVAFQGATAAALTYSKLLGESAEKVAQDMTSMMEQMGMSLDSVRENFAQIYDAAQMSGFGTKRFFGMVLQATTGMSMYNVRLEQTTAMLLNLNKILGTKFGADFFNKLTKSFSGKSVQDSMKSIMWAGQKVMGDALSSTAKYAADGFANVFEKSIKPGGDFGDALTKVFNIDGKRLAADLKDKDKREGAVQELVRKIGSMDPKTFSQAVAVANKELGSDLGRQLMNLGVQVNGVNGTMGEQIAATRAMDPGGVLVTQLKMVNKGNKPLEEMLKMGVIDQMLAENILGLDTETLDQMRNIAVNSAGAWDVMTGMKNSQLTGEELEKEQAKQIQAYGAYGDEQGRVWRAKLDENGKIIEDSKQPVEDVYALMAGRVKADDQVAKVVDEQTALAREVASSTTEMTQYLQMGVEYFLDGIFSAIQKIVSWLTPGLSEGEKKIQQTLVDGANQNEKALLNQRASLQKELKELAVKRDQTAAGPERQKLESDIAQKQAQADAISKQLGAQKTMTKAIKDFNESGWIDYKTPESMLTEIKGQVKGDGIVDTEVTTDQGTEKIQYVDYGKMKDAYLSAYKEMGKEDEARKAMEDAMNSALVPYQKEYVQKANDLEAQLAAGNITSTEMDKKMQQLYDQTVNSADAKFAADSALYNLMAEFLDSSKDGQQGTIDAVEGGMVKTITNQDRDKKAREKKQWKDTKQEFETRIADANAKKEDEYARRRAAEEVIAASGISYTDAGREEAIKALMEGRIPEAISDAIRGSKEKQAALQGKGGAVGSQILAGVKPAEDFLFRVGDNGKVTAMRIDAADSLIGMKPGGAVDQAKGKTKGGGGGGTVINNYNLYNDAQQSLAAITKAQKAGVIE